MIKQLPWPLRRKPLVERSNQSIHIRSTRVFGRDRDATCQAFVARAFQLDEVTSVKVDRQQATATIGFAPELPDFDTVLTRLADALRNEVPTEVPSQLQYCLASYSMCPHRAP